MERQRIDFDRLLTGSRSRQWQLESLRRECNQEHLAILQSGVQAWNQWRGAHSETRPKLAGATLRGLNLTGANFSGADLRGADLCDACIAAANVSRADLRFANLIRGTLS